MQKERIWTSVDGDRKSGEVHLQQVRILSCGNLGEKENETYDSPLGFGFDGLGRGQMREMSAS